MKILVLCYEYPPVGGGGGRVAASVSEGLYVKGHEVRVITAGLRHLSGRNNKNGIEILRPQSFRRREDTCSVFEMALYLLTSFFPAWRLCRDWQPDVIHAHFVVPTGALAFALSKLTHIPYVVTAHLGDVPGGVPEQTNGLFRFVGSFAKRVCQNAISVTAVSSFVADLARRAWNIKPQVILNGIPDPKIPRKELLHSSPRLIMLGRLSIQKDPLLALNALALVQDLDWSLEVIGEGPLAEVTRKTAENLNIVNRIIFLGWLSSEDVTRHLMQSDILLMSSIHEGLPMAGIEALHCGLAIVGSRIGGLLDLVENGKNGFLCERNAAAFAEALRLILTQRKLLKSFQKASFEKAKDFRLSDRVDEYEIVLANAVQRMPRHCDS